MHSTQKKQHDNEKTKISIMYLLLKLMNFPQAMNVSFQACYIYKRKKWTCARLFLRYLSELANSSWRPTMKEPSTQCWRIFSKLLLPKDSGSRKATWNFPEFRPINIAWPLFWFLGLTLMVHLHLVSCSFSDIKYYKYLGWICFCYVKTQFNHTLTLTPSLPSVTKMQPSNNCLSLYRCTWIKLSLRKWSQSSPSTRALKRKKCRQDHANKNIGKRWTEETINNLPILCALLGMVTWPHSKVKWHLGL